MIISQLLDFDSETKIQIKWRVILIDLIQCG